MNSDSFAEFYQGVPAEEVKKYRDFKASHKPKYIDYKGQSVEYYCCGKGEKTILLPPGGGGGLFPPEYNFRTILHFEENYKIIAPGTAPVNKLVDLSEFINMVLDAEDVEKVIILGGSGAGIFGQSYFKRNFHKVEAMILYNTVPPNQEKEKKKWALWLFRVIPAFLIKAIAQKKMTKLTEADVPPEAEARLAFTTASLKEAISTKFAKKSLVSQLEMFFAFNVEDNYKKEDFTDWKGKVLIITCEDDPGYKQVGYLTENLPNNELYTFPKGAGHIPALVHMEKFFVILKEFLDKL